VELRSDAEEGVNEPTLPAHIALRQPPDLPFLLGGHLKTGQSWTLQNRPVDRTQNNLVLHHGCWVRQVFLDRNLLAMGSSVYTDLTWEEDTATQGCDRSADPAAGMAGRRQPPLKRVILA
jgi:hypothetical protein